MAKGIFITATGTDIGKTYVTALLVKKLREAGYSAGYYKAALSGADTIGDSDAGYVNRIAKIDEPEDMLLSYLYRSPVSPHLAAKLEGNPAELSTIIADFQEVQRAYDYVTVEGSGGIVCPIRYDEETCIMLQDLIKAMGLNTIIVADAGLGTINAVTLTAAYLRQCQIGIEGVILNHYSGGIMQKDNIKMIEEIAQVPVLALVEPDADDIDLDMERLLSLYKHKCVRT